MDDLRIDELVRALTHASTRRPLIALAATTLFTPLIGRPETAAKKKKRKKKKKKRRNSPPPPPSPPPGDECVARVSTVDQLLAAVATYNHSQGTLICLAAGTYVLPDGPFGTSDVELGNVHLRGEGSGQTIVRGSGSPNHAVFRIFGLQAKLSRLTVTGGRSSPGSGGGITSVGVVTLEDCVVSDNVGGYGGGIFVVNDTELTLINTTVTGNTASTELPDDGTGGGLFNRGLVTLINSSITGNTAELAGTDNCYSEAEGVITGSGCG